MWSKDIQHGSKNRKESVEVTQRYSYKGIPIYCASGVHEKIFELIRKNFSDKNISILILGAGGGAFDERLIDNGYTNVTAIEFNREVYKSKGNILALDLNHDFSSSFSGAGFDCVIAIEIIEHLENHFHFIRNIDKLLNVNGRLFISTPNVESSLSRVKFWLAGDFPCFTKASVMETGHINPLFRNIFLYYAHNHTGIRLVRTHSNRSVWNMTGGSYPGIVSKMLLVLAFLLSLVILNKDSKEIVILEMKKVN